MSSGNQSAVVGICRGLPDAATLDALRDLFGAGAERLYVQERNPKSPALAGQFGQKVRADKALPGLDLSDAAFHGFGPSEAGMTDLQHRIVLERAREASENGGITAVERVWPTVVLSGVGCDVDVAGGVAAAASQHDSCNDRHGAMPAPDGCGGPFDAGGHSTGVAGGAAVIVLHSAQIGCRAFDHRRIVIASDAPDVAGGLTSEPGPGRPVLRAPPQVPKIAFMFTGQGSQYCGMGADLYRDEPIFAAAVIRCRALLDEDMARDLVRLVFAPARGSKGDTIRLQRTETAEVSLFVMHYALAELLQDWGIRPDLMIGHGIGDFAAACRAGILSLPEALRLVRLRGRLTGEMRRGTMLSVAADPADLPALPADLSIAAVNGPRLVVVAGPTPAVERYEAKLGTVGIGCRRLLSSHAFHSAMMDPMLPEFRAAAAAVTFERPRIPVVSSLTGELVTAFEVGDPDFWARQIRDPVQFAKGCETLLGRGATALLEVGPGCSLSAFARQCGVQARGADIIATMAEPQDASLGLAKALGKLWRAGADVNWTAFRRPAPPRRAPDSSVRASELWIDPTLNRTARNRA